MELGDIPFLARTILLKLKYNCLLLHMSYHKCLTGFP
jgi:hypothetical protein